MAPPRKVARRSEEPCDDVSDDAGIYEDTSSDYDGDSPYVPNDNCSLTSDGDLPIPVPVQPSDNDIADVGKDVTAPSNEEMYTCDVANRDTNDEEEAEENDACVIPDENPKKRPYRYKQRRRRPTEVSSMRKRWSTNIQGRTDLQLKSIRCCARLKCFRNVNIPFLRTKIQRLITLSPDERRHALGHMLGSTGTFYLMGI